MNDIKNPAKAILTLDDAVAYRDSLRKKNKKLVITNGCFDLLHRGHAEYLAESRNLGDALLVLINSDQSVRVLKGENRPIIDEYSRAYLLASLRAVDAVVIFEGAKCHDELTALRPDIYVKGGDYTLEKLDKDERHALMTVGAIICFKPFIPGFSTTNIIEKLK